MSLKDFTTQDLVKELAFRITGTWDFTGNLLVNCFKGSGSNGQFVKKFDL